MNLILNLRKDHFLAVFEMVIMGVWSCLNSKRKMGGRRKAIKLICYFKAQICKIYFSRISRCVGICTRG